MGTLLELVMFFKSQLDPVSVVSLGGDYLQAAQTDEEAVVKVAKEVCGRYPSDNSRKDVIDWKMFITALWRVTRIVSIETQCLGNITNFQRKSMLSSVA